MPGRHRHASWAALLAIVLIASSPSRPYLQAPAHGPAGCNFARPQSTVVLGQCIIASNSEGTVGGLSGALFENGFLWAVTDSPTQSRLLRFGLSLDPNRTESPLRIEAPPREVALRRSAMLGGNAITQAEAMAPSRPNVFWVATEETSPGLYRCDAGTGDCDASVPLPAWFEGIEKRRGIEGLSLSPSGRLLVAALEAPLRASSEAANRWVRLATFDTGASSDQPAVMREYLYPLDSVVTDDPDEGIGASDILFIAEGELLVMERGYFSNCGNTIRLYSVKLDGTSAITSNTSAPLLQKALVLDLSEYGPQLVDLARFGVLWRGKLQERLENFEALTWGPPLPDGAASLLLVSDDNFKRANSTDQVTAVLALRWSALWNRGPTRSPNIPVSRACHERR